MKKLKTTLTLSAATLLVFSNNCFAATDATTEATNTTKYIAIGVAAVIIILLLFLGYKMDSKGNDEVSYVSKKSKRKEKHVKKEEVKYEPDTITYENDNVNTNDLSESVEYEEDDEDSLFSTMDDNDELGIDTPIMKTLEPDPEENLEESENEEYGEEFDTSIIDDIEDEEEIEVPKKNIEETMVFNNPPAKEKEENIVENVDPFLEELNNIDKSETSFEGFSVSSNDDKKDEEKPHKKYTKVKKDSASDDFLAQMEENLKKDKEKRDARKSKK